jgi:predicted ATPase
MGEPLTKLTIRGFKSIESLIDFELGNLTVLIGANGAGKSNFVSFFRLLRAMIDESLQEYVNEAGGGDGFFFLGSKLTPRISAELRFGMNGYKFRLKPTADNHIQIAEEFQQYDTHEYLLSTGTMESRLKTLKDEKSGLHSGSWGIGYYIYKSMNSWTAYHFHDTSALSPMRRDHEFRDDAVFRADGSNIAPFLRTLRENALSRSRYDQLREIVQRMAPFLDDFILEPRALGPAEMLRLEWRQRGSDFPFQPWHLSDGTLRFICLATALMQPNPPATILIDEPELGLHPYALSLVAELIKLAATRTQVIISTQSPTLVDEFEPEQVVVVKRSGAASTFERLSSADLNQWLEAYTLGELWQKNVVRAGPEHG